MPSAEAGTTVTGTGAEGAGRLDRAQWLIGLLMAASAAWLAVRARLPLPYRDDWDWFRWLLGASSFSSYFIPHNEHVIPLARVLLQVQYALEGSSGYTMLASALAAVGGTIWLTLAEVARRWPDARGARRAVGGVVLVILCFAWQLQSVVFPAAVLFPLVQLFAVAALTCLLDAADRDDHTRRWWLAASALCAVAAMLTTTNGLPVPVMLALVAAGRGMSRRVVLGYLALAALAATLYVIVVWVGRPAAATPLGALPPLGLVAGFFLAFHASLVALVSTGGSIVLGGLLFAAGLYAVATTWLRRPRPRLEHFAVGLLLFTMASAALAAPTRASFGIVQVAQSRYASFVQPYWAALLLVAASRLTPAGRRAWAAPVLVASLGAAGAQIVIGAVWIAKADNVAMAGLALRAGGGDDEWMLTLYPSAETPREVSAALVADGDRSLGLPAPELPATGLDDAAVCTGHAVVQPVPRGSGLRLHGGLRVAGDHAALLDRTGHTVGAAAPAPPADAPNPSPMEVARAVWRAVRAPAPDPPRWMGFAAIGAGAPYTLVVLDRDASPLCRLVVTGP